MRVYFAHPQCPWERGANENTNGLLRQFFPAGTRFNRVSRRQIKRVQAMLNDRPRKILNWHSPAHAFHHLFHRSCAIRFAISSERQRNWTTGLAG
jgi:IS30 family transposase